MSSVCSELSEQIDRLAEQKESNHKVTIAIGRMFIEAKEQRDMLAEVAQAVWDRWETPLWKDHPPTALVMNKLRDAIEAVKGEKP